MHANAKHRSRQRGWAGLIVLLLAVLIVGFLAKTVLKQYGLLDGGAAAPGARAPSAGITGASGIDAAAVNVESAAQAPRAPLEQARDMGATVQQQADELAKRMNAAESR
jgi:hypothetical protein